MTGMTENGFINTKAVSYSIDAHVSRSPTAAPMESCCRRPVRPAAGASTSKRASQSTSTTGSPVRSTPSLTLLNRCRPVYVHVRFDFAYDGGGFEYEGGTGNSFHRRPSSCLRAGSTAPWEPSIPWPAKPPMLDSTPSPRHRRLRPLGQRLVRDHPRDHHPPHRRRTGDEISRGAHPRRRPSTRRLVRPTPSHRPRDRRIVPEPGIGSNQQRID